MPCFDLSGFTPLIASQLFQYRFDWNNFERIQTFNSNVSTLRDAGNTTLRYYNYLTNAEQNSFTKGQLLHTLRYPTSNWNSVEKN